MQCSIDAWNNWNKQMYRIRVFDQLVDDTDGNLTLTCLLPRLFEKLKALDGNGLGGQNQALVACRSEFVTASAEGRCC